MTTTNLGLGTDPRMPLPTLMGNGKKAPAVPPSLDLTETALIPIPGSRKQGKRTGMAAIGQHRTHGSRRNGNRVRTGEALSGDALTRRGPMRIMRMGR